MLLEQWLKAVASSLRRGNKERVVTNQSLRRAAKPALALGRRVDEVYVLDGRKFAVQDLLSGMIGSDGRIETILKMEMLRH